MYTNVVRRPLQQALVVLWLMGLLQLGARFLEGDVILIWVFSAATAGVVTALLAGYFRRVELIPLHLLLVLMAFVGLAHIAGITNPVGFALIAVLYALFVWAAAVRAVALPWTERLIQVLGFDGAWSEAGGRYRLEQAIHWTALAIALLAVLAGLPFDSPLSMWQENIGLLVLPLLAFAMAFLWLAGRRYRRRLHSYLFLALLVLGVGLVYLRLSASHAPPGSVPALERGLGLTIALLSLALWLMAWRLSRGVAHGQGDVQKNLYGEPLRVVALGLALFAGAQQLVLVWRDAETGVSLLSALVLSLSGIGLLLVNHALMYAVLSLVGLSFLTLTVVWIHAAWFHSSSPIHLWPGPQAFTDQWLILAALALILSTLAGTLSRHPQWAAHYGRPLHRIALVTYAWTLLGALAAFAIQPLAGEFYLPWVWLVLVITLLPVSRTLPEAARVRAIGVALLLILGVSTLHATIGLGRWNGLIAILLGYALWALSTFAVPWFNARWPQRCLDSESWPWLGLLLVVAGTLDHTLQWTLSWGSLAAVAGYLLLMLRNSAWKGFPWLAVLGLVGAGLVFNGTILDGFRLAQYPIPDIGFTLANGLWANALLLGVRWWGRYGQDLALRLGWRSADLARPLETYALVLLGFWLAAVAALETSALLAIQGVTPSFAGVAVLTAAALLTLSFVHAFGLRQDPLRAHGIIIAVFLSFAAAWLGVAPSISHLPLLLACWSVALLIPHSLWESRGWGGEKVRVLREALSAWVRYSTLVALLALVVVPEMPVVERLAALAVMTGVTAGLGSLRRARGWITAAMVLLVVFLHSWPLVWIPVQQVSLLLPWYALEMVILSAGLLGLKLKRARRQEKSRAAEERQGGGLDLLAHVSQLLPLWIGLALVEGSLHGLGVVLGVLATGQPEWLFGGLDAGAFLMAAALLVFFGVRQAWASGQARWVYAVAGWIGLIGFYLRVLWVGLTPVNGWDTAVLLGAGYLLFVLQRITRSQAIYHLAMILPLLAVLTAPWQLASPHMGGTLLAAALLYLALRQTTGNPIPLYLALLALNASLYLWIPVWAGRYPLFQVYIIPAAVSVLILLHLHRHELKPSVLNGSRLATLSLLYAGATLDVFIRPELTLFVLALALSMAGVVLGIALRTRAFLYTGVVFLVLNVVGQLIQFYPEQRLGRALVLMALGATITGAMIGFNIKRETILQRIRIFRADLETWQ